MFIPTSLTLGRQKNLDSRCSLCGFNFTLPSLRLSSHLLVIVLPSSRDRGLVKSSLWPGVSHVTTPT